MEKVIHEEARDVLFYTGVKCSREVADLFESSEMAWYDEVSGRVHISKKLVNNCLEILPKRHNHPVPNKSFGGGGTAAFWIQGDDAILPTAEIHMADIFRLAEEFKVPFMFKGCGMVDEKDLEIMRKYYTGYIYTEIKNERVVEGLKGDGNLCTAHSIINSPLSFSNVDKINIALDNDLPVYITSMPISCFTGPATIFSLVTMAWAEFLAGMVYVQLKRPRNMVVNGAFPTIGDPRNGYKPALGTFSHNISNYWIQRIADFYSIPSIQSGCTTAASKHTPTECGTDEDTFNGFRLWNSLDNWHQVRHCFGFVNSLTDFNIDKMRRDLVVLNKVIDEDLKYQGEIYNIVYDSEVQDAIYNGIENGFKDTGHTIKNMTIFE